MALDIVDALEPYLSEDQSQWAKLSSDIRWRRTQLLLLREILIELRKLNARGGTEALAAPGGPAEGVEEMDPVGSRDAS